MNIPSHNPDTNTIVFLAWLSSAALMPVMDGVKGMMKKVQLSDRRKKVKRSLGMEAVMLGQ